MRAAGEPEGSSRRVGLAHAANPARADAAGWRGLAASVITDAMSTASELTFLSLPGLHGSGAAHWQSHWERRDPRFRRVEQASWSRPALGDWAAALDGAVRSAPGPVVLVAHSLACALVAHWAGAGATARVRGALLVAPADVERLPPQLGLRSFAPLPRERLPFPARVVASANDPFAALERAAELARSWGAPLDAVGPLGHINVQSGHGAWPEGTRHLVALLADAEARRLRPTG